MAGNRPTGRKTNVTGGGSGNLGRRGSGLGGGPVGNANRPGFGSSGSSGTGSGNRGSSGGGGLGCLLAGLLGSILLKKNSSGTATTAKKSGCLTKIIILVIVIVIGYFLFKSCGSGIMDAIQNITGSSSSSNDLLSLVTGSNTDTDTDTSSSGSDLLSLFTGSTGDATSTTSSGNTTSSSDYKAHAAVTEVSSKAREKYTKLKGNGQDTVTVLIYMCGTDLESEGGMATADLQEIVHSELSDNVNVIIETGGAKKWNNTIMSSSSNQIYQITANAQKTGNGLLCLEKNLGKKSMTDPATLSEFIKYGKTNFAADRYFLILWDHGGGSISGYGYDELFPSGTMTIDEISTALKDGGVKFDFVGFDACLMATLETALVIEPYSDYMIASEATEPGTGWYYTTWLSAVSANTSLSTVEIGKTIIDDFITDSAKKDPTSKATLSLIDLAELKGTVPSSFKTFAQSTSALLNSDDYQKVSDARSSARDFSSSTKINQIDLIHFAENLNTEESSELAQTLRGCIKYNRICASMTNANGISIYFPYQSLGKVNNALSTYSKIGMDEEYTDCIKSFASLAAGGQIVASESNPGTSLFDMLSGSESSGGLGSLLGGLTGSTGSGTSVLSSDTVSTLLGSFLGSSSSTTSGDNGFSAGDILSWFNKDRALEASEYYAQNSITADDFAYSDEDGKAILILPEEKWSLVTSVAVSAFIDDGEGYIDLGVDNVYEYTAAGDLILDYSGNWIAINGQVTPYYLLSEETEGDTYCYTGYVPAMLNGTRVNLLIVFDNNHPDGAIAGAITDYQDTTEAVAKVNMSLNPGDTIDLLCDYYDYDGNYDDSYMFGDQIIVPEDGALIISNVSTGDAPIISMMRLTDIYGNEIWTQGLRN
ncbi:MAG: peptidase C11 [Lachnospiraceae bacterium]|nr:peptidase C11 [Lachnospiraceae bacterium]